mgnify:CR=1 FL=1
MLWLITPLFGAIKNYVKYKQFKILIFLRTPILYIFIFLLIQETNIWKILILERWFLLLYKSFLSLYHNDYVNKKDKYIQKYGLKYRES